MDHKFKLGDEVVVSDPCYTLDTWCMAVIKDVLPGTYIGTRIMVDEKDWGNRVSELIVVHEDFENRQLIWEEQDTVDIGVDSGQAGVFSIESFRNDKWELPGNKMFGNDWSEKSGDDWYQKICDENDYDEGMCSSSGFGDGSYPLFLAKHNGKVIGFKIVFISDDDDDLDDEPWYTDDEDDDN